MKNPWYINLFANFCIGLLTVSVIMFTFNATLLFYAAMEKGKVFQFVVMLGFVIVAYMALGWIVRMFWERIREVRSDYDR